MILLRRALFPRQRWRTCVNAALSPRAMISGIHARQLCNLKPSKNEAVPNDTASRAAKETLYTIPNMISFSRIALSPFLTYAIVNEMHQTAFLATAICGFSDWLDGYIAKNYNMKSVLGGFLDPLSDKIVIAALAIGLTAKGLLPVELTSVIVLRDVLLVAGSFYLRAQERPKGSTFFDTSGSATFKIIPSILSKANTGLQFSVVILTLAHFSFGHPPIYMIEPLWWITGTTTILSGVSYIDGSGIRRIKR